MEEPIVAPLAMTAFGPLRHPAISVTSGSPFFRMDRRDPFDRRSDRTRSEGDIHRSFIQRTFPSTEIWLRLLEAPQCLDPRPPIRKAINVEDDVLIRSEPDIEGDRCEAEVGKA